MLALLFVACTGARGTGDSGGPPGLDDNYGVRETVGDPACENLLLTHCMLPFPSDRFRVGDGRDEWLDFGDAMPWTRAGTPMSGSFFLGVDGYGVSTPILLQWEGATLDGLPEVFHPEQSLSSDSGSVMIDADTGEWIPHWAERDYLTADLEDPLIILRPAIPLPAGHRVVVALRGLRGADGALLDAPAGFAALRDQAASEVVGLHARRLHFDQDVFPVLEDAGLDRGELQLAWDFTVATPDDAIADLLAVRDRMLAIIGDQGPSYVIDSVEEDVDEFIEWKLTGRAFIPSFLLPPDDNGLRLLRRDDEGLPVAEGTEAWPFTLQIPRGLAGGGQAGVLQYGHGFLGSSREADNGWLREMAQSHGFLVLATNLQGMDEDAAAVWIQALTDDPGWFPWFSEPVMQGLANQLALQRMMVGGFLDETDPRWTDGGAPLYDPERVWYAGNSQGGTMGTLMMALSTDVTRGGLGVPGAAYPFLLHRSTVFTETAALLAGIFEDPVDASLLLALLGTGFNRIEPLVYAPHIADDPLPDTPEHAVLLHVAKEDSQVHNQVSFLLGRAVGARIPEDAVEAVWGLDTAAWPMPGPASLVEYDFGVP
ncbi:MAG: hypothetical protein D6798_10255, partial [Deltaproteobacteria bacterium]